VKAPAQALVLEDDPAQLDPIVATLQEMQLEPLPALSPDRAMHRLRYNNPVLAVVDLDMSMAPNSNATVEELLRRLYEEHGGCFVLVYSVWADDIQERKRIETIHPFATFVSKRDGPRALVDRIHRMMGVRFADLVVRRGLTTHEPSGEVFMHSVGVSLVLGASLGQEVVLRETDAKAARRMRDWLHRVGSPVRLVDLGRRCYTLRAPAL
jgi:DNA-binding NarL/FixJ family response regulator